MVSVLSFPVAVTCYLLRHCMIYRDMLRLNDRDNNLNTSEYLSEDILFFFKKGNKISMNFLNNCKHKLLDIF